MKLVVKNVSEVEMGKFRTFLDELYSAGCSARNILDVVDGQVDEEEQDTSLTRLDVVCLNEFLKKIGRQTIAFEIDGEEVS